MMQFLKASIFRKNLVGAVSESVEIGSSVPGRSNPMTYKIDTCPFLAWRSASLGQGKEWLFQYLDNVTECDIGSW